MSGSRLARACGPLRANEGRSRGRAVVLLLVLLATSCGGQDREAGDGRLTDEVSAEVEQFLTAQVDGGSFNDRGQLTVVGVSTVTIEVEEFAFEPTVLVGGAEQELQVVVTNVGDGPHTFTIDEQEVHVAARRNQNGQATVTFPSSDTPVVFYCRFHRDRGMVGALTK